MTTPVDPNKPFTPEYYKVPSLPGGSDAWDLYFTLNPVVDTWSGKLSTLRCLMFTYIYRAGRSGRPLAQDITKAVEVGHRILRILGEETPSDS